MITKKILNNNPKVKDFNFNKWKKLIQLDVNKKTFWEVLYRAKY